MVAVMSVLSLDGKTIRPDSPRHPITAESGISKPGNSDVRYVSIVSVYCQAACFSRMR